MVANLGLGQGGCGNRQSLLLQLVECIVIVDLGVEHCGGFLYGKDRRRLWGGPVEGLDVTVKRVLEGCRRRK